MTQLAKDILPFLLTSINQYWGLEFTPSWDIISIQIQDTSNEVFQINHQSYCRLIFSPAPARAEVGIEPKASGSEVRWSNHYTTRGDKIRSHIQSSYALNTNYTTLVTLGPKAFMRIPSVFVQFLHETIHQTIMHTVNIDVGSHPVIILSWYRLV